MKILLPISLFILLSVFGQSQELVFEKEMKYSKTRETYPVYYPSEDTFALLIKEMRVAQLHVFNSDMHSIIEMSTGYDGLAFPEYLGSFVSGGNVYMYFLHENQKKLLLLVFNVETRGVTSKMIVFQQAKERFVNAFSDTGQLIIVTTTKRQSLINVYLIDSDGNTILKQYDFNDIVFLTGTTPYNLDDLLKRELYSAKIENRFPKNIEAAAKKIKLYYASDQIIISLDNNNDRTTLLILGLGDGSKRKIDTRHGFIQNPELARSNSFIHNDILYQFKASEDELMVSQVGYLTDSLFNTTKVNVSNFASFINSEVSFFGGNNEFVTYKDIDPEKAKNMFRNIPKNYPVIYVAEENNRKLQLIVGGYKYQSQGTGIMLPGMSSMVNLNSGGPSLTTACFAMHIDGKSYSYLSGVIDNCEIGDVSKFIYSKENESADGKEFTVYKNHLSAIKMFRYNEDYYLGYYFKEDKKYYLYRFGESLKK
ncbi:MAG: hypothetical protein DRJ05_03945 [Bacteroidetes bacterium]|nr:MAG: hypothetical protein DRJ05_03945 [Bacteroidota bacterium]